MTGSWSWWRLPLMLLATSWSASALEPGETAVHRCVSIAEGLNPSSHILGLYQWDTYGRMAEVCASAPVDGGAVAVKVAFDIAGYMRRVARMHTFILHPVVTMWRRFQWYLNDTGHTNGTECMVLCVPRVCLQAPNEGSFNGASYVLRALLVQAMYLKMHAGDAKLDSHISEAVGLSAGFPPLELSRDFGECPVAHSECVGCTLSNRSSTEIKLLPLFKPDRSYWKPLKRHRWSSVQKWLRQKREQAFKNGRCFFTLLTSGSYLPGLLVLHHSLIRTRTKYPLCVGMTPGFADPINVRIFREVGLKVVILDPGPFPEHLRRSWERDMWFPYAAKLELFRLDTQGFRKIVFLDSDIVVLGNIDNLFDRPDGSAFVNDHTLEFNSGVMVMEPAEEKYRELCRIRDEHMSRDAPITGMDQEIINSLFRKRHGGAHAFKSTPSLHLDVRYNAHAENLDAIVGHNGPWLKGLPRWGTDAETTLTEYWQCETGGFDHCCNAGGFDLATCTEWGLDYRRCCTSTHTIRRSNLVRIVHFIFAKPWQVTNFSSLRYFDKPLGPVVHRAYDIWWRMAKEVWPFHFELLDSLDALGPRVRDLVAGGDGL